MQDFRAFLIQPRLGVDDLIDRPSHFTQEAKSAIKLRPVFHASARRALICRDLAPGQ